MQTSSARKLSDLETQAIAKFDEFMAEADRLITKQPVAVIQAMHEFHRNLYKSDPYIPLKNTDKDPIDRVQIVIEDCLQFLKASEKMGSYFASKAPLQQFMTSLVPSAEQTHTQSKEGSVQKVYNALWDKFSREHFVDEPKRIIEERFKKGHFSPQDLKGKEVLDMGCGSGRYTFGLAQFGPKMVTGIDLGAESIQRAEGILKEIKLDNVKFQKGSVIDLPFEDNSFDFVFCNGVLHHTDDMEKGIQELFRVLKPGHHAWLYLYANGGLYWHARREMPKVMKKIPMDFTVHVLKELGMPQNRFIFCDNWYVPHERHTYRDELEAMLKDFGYSSFEYVPSDREVDFDQDVVDDTPQARALWGDAELRYFVTK